MPCHTYRRSISALGGTRCREGATPVERRAFTLVEVLVAFGLVSSLFGLVYSNFIAGVRTTEHLSFRLQAVQMACLVRSRLAADLANYIPGPAVHEPLYGSPNLGLRVVTPEDRAGVAGTCLDEDFRPITVPVTYVFDETSGRLYRNEMPLGQLRFEKVSFFHEPYEHGCDRGETVGVNLVIVSDAGADGAERDRRFETQLVFHCPQTTLDREYDDWAVYRF